VNLTLDIPRLANIRLHPIKSLDPVSVSQAAIGPAGGLALDRAWALQPEVLFLDEPTANLDPAASHAVERIINGFHQAGTKIIVTTHELGQARRLADEVLFIHRGRLVEQMPAGPFFRQPRTPEADAFIRGELHW